MNSFFKTKIFSLSEISIFPTKISKYWTYFTNISAFFQTIILNISIFKFLWSYPINPDKLPMNSIIYLGNLSKTKKIAGSRTLGNGMKILENFAENRLYFVEKIEDNQSMTDNFYQAGKFILTKFLKLNYS